MCTKLLQIVYISIRYRPLFALLRGIREGLLGAQVQESTGCGLTKAQKTNLAQSFYRREKLRQIRNPGLGDRALLFWGPKKFGRISC